MNVAVDFASLPPEINSERMYAGPGAAPMLAAASAWSGLATEMGSVALAYRSVVAALTSEGWRGPTSTAMAAAATPYVTWMSTTAAMLEQTAVQATAAATAYQEALAATVPPFAVTANRAQLSVLIVTNTLGQNSPAIAATEAKYAEMWAQDAAAMYAYAGSAAAATRLSQFIEPPQIISRLGLAQQSAAVTQAGIEVAKNDESQLFQLIHSIPDALRELASPALRPWCDPSKILGLLDSESFWDDWGPNANIWSTITVSASNMIIPFVSLISDTAAAPASLAEAASDAVSGASADTLGGISRSGGLDATVAAGLGTAPTVGGLSVPPSWTATAPPSSPAPPLTLGGTPMVAPAPAMAAGLPAMPIGTVSGQGWGRAVPQYGFRPTVVTRPPAAG